MKTLLDSGANLYSSRGGGVVIALASRSSQALKRAMPKWNKPASGPLARRGSNPFPGATFPNAVWTYFNKTCLV